MILISHRGNITGENKTAENHPDFILQSIENGYDCEIDVRYDNGGWYLGHDRPQYKIDFEFLLNDKLWVHCKNIRALARMYEYKDRIKFFYHDKDPYTLVSNGLIWCYTGSKVRENCICVLPEKSSIYSDKELKKSSGICSDVIANYKKFSE